MRAIIDEDACVGCGLCADACPEVFEMDDDVAKVIIVAVPKGSEDTCKEAADACPVDAITVEE